jgi:hypothetical protein
MTTFKNTKFTDLEKQILRNYLPYQSAFDFGQEPMKVQDMGNKVWEVEQVNLSNETIKGVVGSLVNKGILDADDFIWLNEIFRNNEDLLNETIELVK